MTFRYSPQGLPTDLNTTTSTMSFHVTSMPMGRRSTVLLLICGLASIGLVWVSDVIAFLKV